MAEFDLRRVAEIARLRLTDEEMAKLGADLSEILSYFSEINKAEGLGKEKETYYPSKQTHALRKDSSKGSENADAILGHFTRKDGRSMVAPKSLD